MYIFLIHLPVKIKGLEHVVLLYEHVCLSKNTKIANINIKM